jgi:hypothetical protein
MIGKKNPSLLCTQLRLPKIVDQRLGSRRSNHWLRCWLDNPQLFARTTMAGNILLLCLQWLKRDLTLLLRHQYLVDSCPNLRKLTTRLSNMFFGIYGEAEAAEHWIPSFVLPRRYRKTCWRALLWVSWGLDKNRLITIDSAKAMSGLVWVIANIIPPPTADWYLDFSSSFKRGSATSGSSFQFVGKGIAFGEQCSIPKHCSSSSMYDDWCKRIGLSGLCSISMPKY